MKKILIAASFITSLSALSANAADLVAGTAFQGTGTVPKTACPLLDLDGEAKVTLSLSKNVHGVFNCNESESIISFATCHEGGSRQESMTTPTDGSTPVAFTDYKGYFASSRGGSIGPGALGGKCSASTVAAFLTTEVAKITD
ncbi:hypothetical protein [Stutzerimonas stutzeri]|jgi:hypothetical protein|uniref:Uncharacterized protein n=1 Tax=Stutzerimonas stutzeri TaxID=316 RepID=A0A5S5B8H0_STUST|nr:hypothetical protein [Stutzerimonas stutzeri]TYP63307.1 hypothetical protein A9A72_12375 [Stutzerimonas stutzeri]